MKMKRSTIVGGAILAVALSCVSVRSIAQDQNQPATRTARTAPKRQGFFDYALGKINPHDKNCGASIESARNAVVQYTIDDLYFWSNVVTLVLLSGLVALVLFQWRAMDKREVIAASLIAQLWNGRVSDRIEIEGRTRQFNQLVENHNAEAEGAWSQGPRSSEQDSDTTRSQARSLRKVPEGAGSSPAEAERIAAVASDADAASMQQSNLLLQRRVEALQNSEQNLKQRLNQMTVLLDQERRRNGTLKGA